MEIEKLKKSGTIFAVVVLLAAAFFVLVFESNLFSEDIKAEQHENKASDQFSPPAVDKVILISVDTLRPDFLGCYDSSRRTPAIDSFAEEGILFEDAQCHNPLTVPSHATMLTGVHTWTHGLRANRGKISPKVKVLPEILKEQGWQTGGFVSLGTVSSKFGFNRGFDKFDDTRNRRIGYLRERIAMDTVKTALKWLDKKREDKAFLFLHLSDPHGPYTPPKEYISEMGPVKEKPVLPLSSSNHPKDGIPKFQKIGDHNEADFYIKRYEAEVKYVDDSMALFFKKLKEWGLYDKSLIIFTSDHGEAMGEHHIWFQHGTSLYFSQTAVPLIFKFPGCEKGARIKGVVGTVDLSPTILRFLGIKETYNMQGHSLLDLLANPQKNSRLVWHGDIKHLRRYFGQAVIMGQMKLINMRGKKPELYNIEDDPAEKQNVINEYPDQKTKLKNNLEAFRSEITSHKAKKQNLSPKQKQKRRKSMKSLGYIDE